MQASESRAQEIAACLSEAGYEPLVTHPPHHIRIDVEISDTPSAARWLVLLAALERADRFGSRGSAGRVTAWAVICTETCSETEYHEVPQPPEGERE